MKKLKSGLLIFMSLLLAFSSCLVSCGEGSGEETAAETVLNNTSDAEYYIPENKYDNEEITILCPTDSGEWSCGDFYEETSSDEPVPNAVFERKTKIESIFGVKIKVVEDVHGNDINEMVRKAHDAGLLEYDIIMNSTPGAFTLAEDDYIMNLNAMGDYLDLKHESWDQSFLEQTSIGGNNYFATGEITTMDNDGTWVMMFNKELAEANDIKPSEIYNSVINGTWTLDKLYEYTSNFYQELDNDSKISEGDQYGVATTSDFIQGLFYGAGGRIVTKDSDDIPKVNFNNEHNLNLVNKIIDIYYKSNRITFDCLDYVHIDPAAHLISQAMFEENRALFYSEVMQCAIRLREMETEFGIIPMPKYDTNQKDYTTHIVAATALVTCFPKLLENEAYTNRRDMIAMVAQALSVEGKNILTPAYYEKSLMYKGARDDESRAMLPIIFANRVCDLGYMTEGNDIAALYANMKIMVKDGSNTIASVDKKFGTRVQTALQKMVAKFEG